MKTTFSLSYLLAIFLNPIFNHAKNRSIVPLFLYDSYSSLVGLSLLRYFRFLILIEMLLFIALRLKYFLIDFLNLASSGTRLSSDFVKPVPLNEDLEVLIYP
ncbi:hypothetical protein SAMN04488589_0470 [Methanolobus vulcani]|uniref:Uncharacterized protein n=1 Tax=Methanolobus vulcani TaxID=38026 RepID=A0A7Z7B029_9EURY|nr:hypothetical protein SAMN04488589_0470 [Methanolobus vulcani]